MEITYWTGHADTNPNVAGEAISSETVALDALSGATPTSAAILSLYATEAARFDYSSATSSASGTTSHYIGAGERLWIEAHAGWKVDTATPA